MNVKASRGRLLQGFERLVQPRPWQGPGNDQSLKTDDGYPSKLGILCATSNDEGIHKVDFLGKFLAKR